MTMTDSNHRHIHTRDEIESVSHMLSDDHLMLLMAVANGANYSALVQAFAKPLGTIKSRLHRARVEIDKHLAANKAVDERLKQEA